MTLPPLGRATAVAAVVLGAGLALLAASRTWIVETEVRPAPLPALREVRTGDALVPWLPALAYVALAGAGALLATRGPLRAVVGGLLVLSGVGLVAGALSQVGTAAAVPWPLAAAVGGLAVAVGGALTVARGRSWPGMAARYERPAAEPARPVQRTRSKAEIWDALDRGDDPTC
jgi:hypothetical protein